jgi:hypothetical protein
MKKTNIKKTPDNEVVTIIMFSNSSHCFRIFLIYTFCEILAENVFYSRILIFKSLNIFTNPKGVLINVYNVFLIIFLIKLIEVNGNFISAVMKTRLIMDQKAKKCSLSSVLSVVLNSFSVLKTHI